MKQYFILVLLNLYDKVELVIDNYFTAIHDEELRWANMAIVIQELQEKDLIYWEEDPFILDSHSLSDSHVPLLKLENIKLTQKGLTYIETLIEKFDL